MASTSVLSPLQNRSGEDTVTCHFSYPLFLIILVLAPLRFSFYLVLFTRALSRAYVSRRLLHETGGRSSSTEVCCHFRRLSFRSANRGREAGLVDHTLSRYPLRCRVTVKQHDFNFQCVSCLTDPPNRMSSKDKEYVRRNKERPYSASTPSGQ